jgi:hypothetical protein
MCLDLALAFAAANLPVFPVDIYFDEEKQRWRKVPFIRDWEQRASINPHVIRMWWRQWPSAWPGVPPGRINKVVVDADRHPGQVDGVELFHELERSYGPFPAHPIVVTKSGGEHHWFAQPSMPISYAQWKGGELHGHRRFVVGYALPHGEMPELPAVFWPLGHTHMVTTYRGAQGLKGGMVNDVTMCVPAGATRYQRNWARRALENAWSGLRRAKVGERNYRLNGMAYALGRLVARGWIGRGQVEHFLLWACRDNGLLKDDGVEQCRKTLASGLNAGAMRPYHDVEPQS